MEKTKHEIANDYVYKATMALAEAITEDINELAKDNKEVVINTCYSAYGIDIVEVWLGSIKDNKVYFTSEFGVEHELDDMPIEKLIDINNALLCGNYHY